MITALLTTWVVSAALGSAVPVDEMEFTTREACLVHMNQRYSSAVIYTFHLDCRRQVRS
jgi:hypothetical protein